MRTLRNNPWILALIALFAMLLGALPASAAPSSDPLPPPPPFSMMGDVYAVGGVTSAVPHTQLDLVPPHCVNTLGMGTQEFLSDKCGVYLAERGEVTPKEVADSNGSIQYYDQLNHYMLPYAAEAHVPLNEGAFTFFSMGYGDLRIRADRADIGIQRDIFLHLTGAPLNNYHVYVRGLYRDNKTPADRNSDILVTNYEAGHVEVAHLPRGAWISLGTTIQKIKTSMTGSNNCGDAGCPRLTLIFVDLNSEAVVIIYVTMDSAGQLHYTLAWSNIDVS